MPYKDQEKRKSYHREYQKRYMTKWRRENPEKVQVIEHKRYLKRGPQTHYLRAWIKSNPDKVLAARLKKYGISLEDYYRLVNKQEGACAICRIQNDNLQVDHDHETNVVRGLLCSKCNIQVSSNSATSINNILLYLQYPPFKITQDVWDRKFLELAVVVSSKSPDPSTKVGAVITTGDPCIPKVISTGYNTFARGVSITKDRLTDRPTKLKYMVHAEQNAIIQAGERVRGGTIYVFPPFGHPNICHDCAKLAIQAGIKRVVGYKADEDNPRLANWKESLELSGQMFKEAGVDWYWIEQK